MDGQTVLEALSKIRVCLQQAIGFSNGHDNQSGGQYLLGDDATDRPHERIEEWWGRCEGRHVGWQKELEQALSVLEKERFHFPFEWTHLDISQPQVALTEYPIERFTNGIPTGKVWIVGAGTSSLPDGPFPEDEEFGVCAGEHLQKKQFDDPKKDNEGDGPGIFADRLVREWEKLFQDIESEELAIQRGRIEWQESTEGSSPPMRASLPLIELGPNLGEITWEGTTYASIDVEACELLQELCEAYPVPKGLTTDLRPQPKRVIGKLPKAIQDIIQTSQKGRVLTL